jgi:RNA polymerase sigma factor for flagellar operon FliA
MTVSRAPESREITDRLWAEYVRDHDPAVRSRLLDQYLGLVHFAAREIARQLPPTLELDDLVSAGTVGLVQALEGFDPARGFAFSTFALPRIRGAIKDLIRSWDWRPRSVREHGQELRRAEEDLRVQLGHEPSPEEVAAHLGVDLDTYWRMAAGAREPILVPLDPAGAGSGDAEALPLSELLADSSDEGAQAGLEEDERMSGLAAAFGSLPERDRLILTLSYYERLTLQDIGSVLHITESRVSQLRTRALRRLMERIEPEEMAA